MRDLLLLLSPRLLGVRNRFLRPADAKKKRVMTLAVLGLVFGGGMFLLSLRILRHFQSAEIIGEFLARQLFSMVILTFFTLLVFSHVISALSNLYLSRDLACCHATPVRLETLFTARCIFTFVDSSWMLALFGLPIYVAYGVVYGAGPDYYLALVHLNLAMVLIAGGIGILVTMILVDAFPARRARDLMMLLTVLLIGVLYLMFRLMRPERLVNPDAFFTVAQYLSALKAPQSPYLPTRWISDALWGQLHGAGLSEGLFSKALTWSTAGSITFVNIWVARAIYFRGFSKSQEAGGRRSAAARVLAKAGDLIGRWFPGAPGAVAGKDLRTFFRDNTQWSQLLLLAALVAVYLYNFSVLPLDKTPLRLDFLQNELGFINMGLAGFVIAAVAARFVFTAVSAEGGAYWIIRSAPIETGRYLWGKFVFFLCPLLLLAEILIVATNHLLDVSPFMMWLTSATMCLTVFGIVALGIGMGALYPDFRHQNIAQVSTGFGGVLFMIVSVLFIGTVIVLEAGPVYLLYLADWRGVPIRGWQWVFIVGSFFWVLVVQFLAIWLPMRLGVKALDHCEV